MENVKYILIVSQYYYSHHCFVVSPKEENFREKALTLIEKLEDHKRGGGDYGEYRYGYSREKAYTDVNARWNVNDINDAGDIYFIPCPSILSALNHAKDYNSELNFFKTYKKRINKIDLAPEIKSTIEEMITSHEFTYAEIARYIQENTGLMISPQSVCILEKSLGLFHKPIRMADEIARNHSYCAVRDIVGSVFEIL